MKLVVVFLNRTELLEDVLEGLLEIGVSGATVVDSVGMGRILSHDVPVFSGLRQMFPGAAPVNKTIFLVTEEALIDDVMMVLEDVCGSFSKPGVGVVAVLPLDRVEGLRPGF